jgi:leucyl-tRNA synthetase
VRRKIHETIAKVSDDYGRRQTFNTAIAAVMELCNELSKLDRDKPQSLAIEKEALETAVLLLTPIVPHISQCLWQAFGHGKANSQDLVNATWPKVDEAALIKTSLELAVQINGKVRGKIEVAADASDEQIIALALSQENVQKFLDGKTIKMQKVIPGKLVTIAAK